MKAAVRAVVCLVVIACMAFLWLNEDTTTPDIPSAPTQDIYVADFENMVEPEERQKILSIGQDLDNRFGAQLVVVTIDTLNEEDIESYANRLFRTWGIGDAEKNNGVLLLIAKGDRKFRIEVGYGLEGAITDGYAGEVLDGMKGKFRSEAYSAGIYEAYQKLARKVYENYGTEVPSSVLTAPQPAIPAETPPVAEMETEWWEDILYYGISIILVLVVAFLFYGVIGPLVSMAMLLAINIFMNILGVLLYIITMGRLGSLKWQSYTNNDNDDNDDNFWSGGSGGSSSYSSSDSSSSSSSSGGYGGGSSRGGGSSGGW